MLKNKSLLLAAAIMALLISTQDAPGQADEKKFEVGGQFSLINLTKQTLTTTTFPCVAPVPCPVAVTLVEGRRTEPGFGGRFGYNLSRYVALEAEGNFFPRDRDLDGGRSAQGLFGARVGRRFDKVGVFAKARPGFMRFSKGDYRPVGGCVAVFPPPIGCFEAVPRTNFAFDVGGVAEWYPSKNAILRFDAGDTIIHFGNRNVAAVDVPVGGLGPTRLVVVPVGAETKHNFQASAGVGFRF
jgi:Outer membrane protein beta-barrel domain